jgi:hypothetical protein
MIAKYPTYLIYIEMAEKEEIWKEIAGFPDYLISDWGNVWSSRNERILNPGANGVGYLRVHLPGSRDQLVHRLVAIAFIDNPDAKKFVDHKDGNCTNNHVDNLRWASHSENARNSSGLKGVNFDKSLQKWRAQISINNKSTHIGHYLNLVDAIAAYQTRAKEEFGVFYREP